MKVRSLLLIGTVLHLLSVRAGAGADEPGRACFITASNADIHLPHLRSNYLFYGHELAFKHYRSLHPEQALELLRYSSERTDVDLLDALHRAIADRCAIVLGLFTSREALLAAPLLQQAGIPAFSVSASHQDLERWHPIIYTGASSSRAYVQAIVEKVHSLGEITPVILNTVDDLYSNFYTNSLKERLPSAHVLRLYSGDAGTPVLKALRPGERYAFLFTTYSMPSLPLLKGLTADGFLSSDSVVIGSPAWSFDLAAFKNIASELGTHAKVIFPATWDMSSHLSKKFIGEFERAYGTFPQGDAVYAYDTTLIALECLTTFSATMPQNGTLLRDCLPRKQWTGVSGPFRFTAASAFPERKIQFFDFFAVMKDVN